MKKRSELIFSLIQVPLDYAMMVLGFVVAYFVRIGESKPLAFPIGGRAYLDLMLIVLPIWVLIFAMVGLYNLDSNRGRLREAARVGAACMAGTMVLIMLDFFNIDPVFPSKSIPIFGLVFAFIFVLIARLIVLGIQNFLHAYGIGVQRVLIVGHSEVGLKLLSTHSKYSGVRFVNSAKGFEMPKTLDQLVNLKEKLPFDSVIQVVDTKLSMGQDEIIQWCHQNHVGYSYVPGVSGVFRSNIKTGLFFGVPTIQLPQTPLDGWGRIFKRIVDFFASLFALVILSPLFLLIAIVIKIVDPGPVFFSHERLSRTGKKMKVYKFRSMRWKYCDGGPNGGKSALELIEEFGKKELVEEFKRDQKLKEDPRVSSVGKFLRRSSLDEIPQFLNVLKGDLSLVGPRPIVEKELSRYGKRAGAFLAIRPGLTGLWQVSGRNDVSYEDRVKLDIFYVENWSLGLDISIILKTIVVLMRGGSGY